MKLELGLSPALALVLFGCTTTTPKEPAPTSCRVEIQVEDESRVDLGSRSCEETRTVVIARRDRVPDSYFVAIMIDGSPDHPIVSSDVVPISSTSSTSATADVLARHFPPLPGANPPTASSMTPPSAHAIVPGEWSEAERTAPGRVSLRGVHCIQPHLTRRRIAVSEVRF
jgi:hypothetical protein